MPTIQRYGYLALQGREGKIQHVKDHAMTPTHRRSQQSALRLPAARCKNDMMAAGFKVMVVKQ